jgi:hypothetical protein
MPLVDPVRLAEPLDVGVEQEHLGLHAEGDRGCVHPRDAGTDHDDLGGVDARRAPHQHAPASRLPLQAVGADLGCHPAGDLGHRGEQRERAVGELHRLVGDRGDAGVEQCPGAGLRGGDVEVGEEHLVLAHPPVLLGHGLLHLEHQVGCPPDRIGVREDGGPEGDEVLVGEGGAVPGAPLDHDLVAQRNQLADSGRRECHPVLVVLDFAGNTDSHRLSPFSGPGPASLPAPLPAHTRGFASIALPACVGAGRGVRGLVVLITTFAQGTTVDK